MEIKRKELLVVCTDDNQQPGSIMDAAQKLAEKEQMGMRLLCVVSACKADSKAMGARLDQIFERSKRSGAEMIVYFTDKKSDIVRSYISKNSIKEVMTSDGECSHMLCQLEKEGLGVHVWGVECNHSYVGLP